MNYTKLREELREEMFNKFETYSWEKGTEYEGKFEDYPDSILNFFLKKIQKREREIYKEIERAINITPEGSFEDLKDNIEEALAILTLQGDNK